MVRQYYAAINAGDYRAAWALGGENLAADYATFADGFAGTTADTLLVDGVQGNTVNVRLHAEHSDGTSADYAGSYTVVNGEITGASVHLTGTGGGPTTPTAPTAPAAGGGSLNPAVTQTTIRSTICVAGWTATVRPPVSYTDALKIGQLAASGRADQDPSHYEEDHIVPLELGGAPMDLANLRPVPSGRAARDDVVETRLHTAVCNGTLTLAQAQAQILAAKAGE
ncbi:hypothetical protein [Kitasatospora sp. MMS16-BH015]|uniref:hypothetical protein n=1 Tax=Kitasatospora sp. MMS16-BH015 TaxID=2018025 RepID=UPI000CF279ED|nr:hypothetical protein [Kitasatospora sp. MMS16-BH015]